VRHSYIYDHIVIYFLITFISAGPNGTIDNEHEEKEVKMTLKYTIPNDEFLKSIGIGGVGNNKYAIIPINSTGRF
jgi:hypothetical protein